MKKNISRIIATVMLIIAGVFIVYALNHPEGSFPWRSSIITFGLYIIYIVVMVVLFIAPFKKNKE